LLFQCGWRGYKGGAYESTMQAHICRGVADKDDKDEREGVYIKGRLVGYPEKLSCFGDREIAFDQEDEVTVAFPYSMYDKILEGMRQTVNVAAYPTPFDIDFPQMPDYTLTPWAVEYRRRHLTKM
jgi:hypothetical protein